MKDIINNSGGYPAAGTPGTTSWTLIEGVKAGDKESRKRFVFLYGPLVLDRYLTKVGPQDRMDVFQEVFMTVFAKIRDFEKRREGSSFRPWLHQIARFKVGDHIHKQRRLNGIIAGSEAEALLTQEGVSGEIDAPADADERLILCRRAMELAGSEFEPGTWEAAKRAIEGEPIASIASALNKTANAVRIAKTRVLGRIREILKDLGEHVGEQDTPDDPTGGRS